MFFPSPHFTMIDIISCKCFYGCYIWKTYRAQNMFMYKHMYLMSLQILKELLSGVKIYYAAHFSCSSVLSQMKLLCIQDWTKMYVMVLGCDLWRDNIINAFWSALYYNSRLMDLDSILLDGVLFRDLFPCSGFCIHQ